MVVWYSKNIVFYQRRSACGDEMQGMSGAGAAGYQLQGGYAALHGMRREFQAFGVYRRD
jgi:hypothetical protein